ncbi:MAG: alkaline phosphatase family protein [Gemmatimonadetes bacterium]|nr:alkaline phosphatase family protein [Gemmatimonadota bacterium]
MASLLALLGGAGCAATPAPAPDPDVRLVVALVVDQLRADLLTRYDTLFTGGFRRLADQGFRYTNATQDHAVTETAAGHATLSTGVVPSKHGIVSNTWYEERDGTWTAVYAVEDPSSPVLGEPDLEGRSPANLERDGLADWMRAHRPEARVASVSRKDRAAITMAARQRGEVYWLSPGSGRFVTSAFYTDAYPGWLDRFNRDTLPVFYADSVWEQKWPEKRFATPRGDTAAYEGDGVHSYFPHRFTDESRRQDTRGFNLWIAETPVIDAATLALARAALTELALGQDSVPDYLSVSLSQTDAVGHDYGPLSREQLDNLLRLDQELGDFLAFLDRTVGPEHWVLGLSADHGVVDVPEYLASLGVDAGRLNRAQLDEVRKILDSVSTPTGAQRVRDLSAALPRLPFIVSAPILGYVADTEQAADTFQRLWENSWFPGRATGPLAAEGLEVLLTEHWLWTTDLRGTTHGSPYLYDRSVPLVFLGAGVRAGSSDEPARTVDFAPTLAALAGIPTPADLDGRPLPVSR